MEGCLNYSLSSKSEAVGTFPEYSLEWMIEELDSERIQVEGCTGYAPQYVRE